jgi:hypothetical protein
VLNVMFAALLGSFSLGLVSDAAVLMTTPVHPPAACTLVCDCRPACMAYMLQKLRIPELLQGIPDRDAVGLSCTCVHSCLCV